MKRFVAMSIAALLVIIVFLAFSRHTPSEVYLEELAKNGSIQENAPVKASSEITIDAPPEKVWSLITAINNWPKWHHDITEAEITAAVQSGTRFNWTNGTEIHSQIALVRPFQELVWTGTAYKAHAIHVWKFQRLPGNRTLVTTNESMDGFLLTLFYSSKKLAESNQHWLNDLKTAAEQ